MALTPCGVANAYLDILLTTPGAVDSAIALCSLDGWTSLMYRMIDRGLRESTGSLAALAFGPSCPRFISLARYVLPLFLPQPPDSASLCSTREESSYLEPLP
eukprot:2873165-Pleurochrysis_carterae.AAC.1